MKSKPSFNPKKSCFPPRELSDAALNDYWLKTAKTLPPTDAQIKASAKETSKLGELIHKTTVDWHIRNGF